MEMTVMKVREWHEKFLSRRKAKEVNNMFLSATKPDRTELKKEAAEFSEWLKSKHSARNI